MTKQGLAGACALMLSAALAGMAVLGGTQSMAQPKAAPKPTPWFGAPAPGPISDLDRPTFTTAADDYGPAPSHLAKPAPASLRAGKLMADMKTIVGFSRESRAAGDPIWGRVSGMPAERKTVEWAVARMKAAGIANAHSEEFTMDRPLWMPKTWSVKILADASFGAGTGDVTLQSAVPVASGKSIAGVLSAPLVFVGRGSAAELANVDLKGKIAVVNVVPDTSLFASREKGAARAAADRGAVAVINAVESPGNLQFFDSRYGCGDVPCFSNDTLRAAPALKAP